MLSDHQINIAGRLGNFIQENNLISEIMEERDSYFIDKCPPSGEKLISVLTIVNSSDDMRDSSNVLLNSKMGHNATEHVFRVSNKVRFKPVCSATETS